MKIVIYTDGKPAALTSLRIGADLSRRLDAEVCFLTARPGTYATEQPPPLGVEFPKARWRELPPGIQIIVQAMEQLVEMDFLVTQGTVNIREVQNGYLFLGSTTAGRPVPFYERYGHLIDALNQEVDEHQHDLVVVAPPRRSGLGRLVVGDTARLLAHDLHTSVMVVRGGDLNGRFLVCADGSPSARRLFPLLKQVLPAAHGPVDLIWVRKPGASEEEFRAGTECVERARAWLDRCGKGGDLLMPEGDRPQDVILEAAGENSVVVMGASLRHDVHHRVRGSLPLQVLSRTESSLLLAKLPPDVDTGFFEGTANC